MIPLMINKMLKNPNINGKIWENIIINPFAIYITLILFTII
jgi:hypothetical protein